MLSKVQGRTSMALITRMVMIQVSTYGVSLWHYYLFLMIIKFLYLFYGKRNIQKFHAPVGYILHHYFKVFIHKYEYYKTFPKVFTYLQLELFCYTSGWRQNLDSETFYFLSRQWITLKENSTVMILVHCNKSLDSQLELLCLYIVLLLDRTVFCKCLTVAESVSQ